SPSMGHGSVTVLGAEGQHLDPRLRHEHRMLPLRRKRVIFRYNRPAVRQEAHVSLAGVHHRLHGERHARAELQARTRFAVVQHLRVFVVNPPDTVTAILPYHGVVLALDEFLDGVADVAEARARAYGFDAAPHGVVAHLDEPLSMG